MPRWYKTLAGHTPRSVWTQAGDTSLPRLMALIKDFGDHPVIVKDFVKSRKHEWLDACSIPSAADAEAVARVTGKFLELQGDELSGGLVLREFVEFEPLGTHAKSGMPLTREFRLFFLDGQPIQVSKYWDQGAILLRLECHLVDKQTVFAPLRSWSAESAARYQSVLPVRGTPAVGPKETFCRMSSCTPPSVKRAVSVTA